MSLISLSLIILSSWTALIVGTTTLVEESNQILHQDVHTRQEASAGSSVLRRSPHKGGPFRAVVAPLEDRTFVKGQDDDDPGEPLFITPLLRSGKLKEARDKSRVQIGHRYGHSYAGFFTVNHEYNANIYFWFFPARVNADSAPVVVWLQGGPGGSSLFGLFAENGPFYVDEQIHLNERKYSWNANFSVIYIDNPVGTGFSFTENERGYARNEAEVGADLFNVMVQFYTLFPELLKNDLYVTGESYAGKYVPALSYMIHKMNLDSQFTINLKGIAIGDGFSDPVSMTDYGDLLYEIGLVDSKARDHFLKEAQTAVEYINQQKWVEAFKIFDSLLDGDMTSCSYFTNVTGLTNYYNFLLEKLPKDLNYWEEFVNRASSRRQMNVGNLTLHSGEKVEKYLEADIMKSVKPWIETIASNYKVMFYNGQLDIIVAAALTDNFIKSMKWKGSEEFKAAPRNIWTVDGEVAGYYTAHNNFIQVLVRNAGHLVPYDQPKWAFDMISRFVFEDDFAANSS